MSSELPDGLLVRHPTAADQSRVLAVTDDWWGGLGGAAGSTQRALLLPRLFFQHFTDTSYLVERADDGRLTGFLIGFLSQSSPEAAYIHFVGVDPGLRRSGVAAALYRRFFGLAAARGARRVDCVTSPGNWTSLAFHTGLGFQVGPGDTTIDGVAVHSDYDGPGLHRVVFTRVLPDPTLPAPPTPAPTAPLTTAPDGTVPASPVPCPSSPDDSAGVRAVPVATTGVPGGPPVPTVSAPPESATSGRDGRDLRVCFVGDSYTAGVGDPARLGWVGRLTARAEREHGDGALALTVYNLGIRMDTSADIRARWRHECHPRLAPAPQARLVLSFGVNDMTAAGQGTRVPADTSVAHLAALIREASPTADVMMVGPPPSGDPGRDERVAALSQRYAAVCAAHDVPYVDVFTPLRDDPTWRRELADGDGAHPGAAGYQRLADLVADPWRRWLDPPRPLRRSTPAP